MGEMNGHRVECEDLHELRRAVARLIPLDIRDSDNYLPVMARIEVVDHHESDGELREIYDELIRSRGKLAEVHKIQSLHPKSIRDHMALYMTTMFTASPLTRTERETALCEYAQLVTEEPGSPAVDDAISVMREAGLDDRAVLDATLVTAYFNFVNRIVLALGVELEPDAGGYDYE